MRSNLAAFLALALVVAGCNTVRTVDGWAAPLGKRLELNLPATPGYPVALEAAQTIIAQYGEQRTAFQAVLMLTPDRAEVVLTSAGGPRILTITWTPAGIVEDRTPLAPDDLKGINILADIFVSLWPIEAVRAALPPGLTVLDEGKLRTISAGNRVVVRIETVDEGQILTRQELANLDFGYKLSIITEKAT